METQFIIFCHTNGVTAVEVLNGHGNVVKEYVGATIEINGHTIRVNRVDEPYILLDFNNTIITHR